MQLREPLLADLKSRGKRSNFRVYNRYKEVEPDIYDTQRSLSRANLCFPAALLVYITRYRVFFNIPPVKRPKKLNPTSYSSSATQKDRQAERERERERMFIEPGERDDPLLTLETSLNRGWSSLIATSIASGIMKILLALSDRWDDLTTNATETAFCVGALLAIAFAAGCAARSEISHVRASETRWKFRIESPAENNARARWLLFYVNFLNIRIQSDSVVSRIDDSREP